MKPSRPKKSKRGLPEGFGISDRVKAWAAEHGYGDLEARLEHFVGYAQANGKTYADWDAAFMNAIRGNWARIGADRQTKDWWTQAGFSSPYEAENAGCTRWIAHQWRDRKRMEAHA